MLQPTTSRKLPTKPVRIEPTEVNKQYSSAEALDCLNEFVKEARKEIRKREKLSMKGKLRKNDCESLSFLFDTFSLTIDFTGGITV